MTVCIYFHNMNGTVMTLLDTFLFLREKIDLKCTVIVDSYISFLPFIEYFPNDIDIIVNRSPIFIKDDILICSAYLFKSIVLNRINILFSYKRIFIFDSTSFVLDKLIGNQTISFIKSLSNYTILGNYYNKRFFDKNYIIFTPPIYFNRLDDCSITHNSIYTRNINQRNKNNHPLNFRSLYFYRSVKIKDAFYYENIGRLLFEYLYLNRKVYYSSRNKSINDGLTQHLIGIGVDDNRNSIITNKKERVIDYFKFDINTFSSLL